MMMMVVVVVVVMMMMVVVVVVLCFSILCSLIPCFSQITTFFYYQVTPYFKRGDFKRLMDSQYACKQAINEEVLLVNNFKYFLLFARGP